MKTAGILCIVLICLIAVSSAAYASINLPSNFREMLSKKIPAQNAQQAVVKQAAVPAQIAPVTTQPIASQAISTSIPTGILSLEKQYMKEDEKKIADETLSTSSYTLRKPPRAWVEIIRRPVRGFIPREGAKYPFGLSDADKANPVLSSVNIRKYQDFQSAHREILDKIIWVDDANKQGRSIVYSNEKMQALTHYIALLEAGQVFPSSVPPAGFDVPWGEHLDSTRKFYTENEALNMWLPHLALSFYVEVNHIVPWSIVSMPAEQQSFLLDSRHFINYYSLPSNSGYTFFLNWETGGGITGITDWNPFYSYDFLTDNSMIKPTQQETIYSLTQWMRENLYHEAAANAYAQHLAYGYNGSYPLDKVLNPPSGQKHWTQGCSGTVSMYSALFRTINIPVSINLTLGGHRAPLFSTANLALMHGDDPYGLVNRRGLQETPVEEIFLSIADFYALNHAEPEQYNGYMPNRAEMAGYLHSKRTYQNGYEHMAYALLKKRGEDVIMYLPNRIYNSTLGYWWLNETWRPIFDVEEVPVMLENLDAEIMRIGEGDYTTGNLRICRGLIPRPGYC